MDFLDELETLAISATYEEPEGDTASYDPAHGTIRMWQDRFGYTYEQAARLIRIAESAKKSPTATQQVILSPAQARTIYALKLGGPIPTPQSVQAVAGLPTIPEAYHGSGEEEEAVFCKVDGQTKLAIDDWLSKQVNCNFKPLFVAEGKAYKELSDSSLYPTLGKDTTLPQYRPKDHHLRDRPSSFGRTQDQFPVWYFFYSTLASIPKLCSLFSVSENEIARLQDASMMGGSMKTWGQGKCNALVDGPEENCIEGSAYLVMSEEHESALGKYEAASYEVVRCLIKINDSTVQGCTFRFVGETD